MRRKSESGLGQSSVLNIIETSKVHGYHQFDGLYKTLYKKMHQMGMVRPQLDDIHGAIFNLEFSLDGKVVVAACEKGCLSIYDPLKHTKIHQIIDAHGDCVNCIHFLDRITFATGSDDKTIKLWDLRKTSTAISTLQGHRGWVKNIGYDKNARLLLSSAFDQTVKIWDIDRISSNDDNDDGVVGETVINTDKLLRCRLSNSCSKLFLAMTDGAGITTIHDVNLLKMKMDFQGIDMTNQAFNKRKTSHRNRVDVITEFPKEIWCVYSLNVHPFDWCIVSRYLSKDGREHLVVHDIQDVHIGGCNDDCDHVNSKMTYFMKESKSAAGFIKEICFSPDGRLISSPYHHGIRLLAFDQHCSELSHCVSDKHMPLNVVTTIMSHERSVLTSAFSPILPLLVTGCRAGEVQFHHPKF